MKTVAHWLVVGGTALASGFYDGAAAAAKPSMNPIVAGLDFDDAKVVAVRAKRVLVRPGVTLSDAVVLVRDGVIEAVGEDLAVPEGARVVEGSVCCAGFIDPWSALGLESGVLSDPSPDAATRTADGLDPYEGDHLRTQALAAGVTSVRLQGGRSAAIGGLGAMVRLDPDLPAGASLLDDRTSLAMAVGLSVDGGSQFIQRPDGTFTMISGERAVDPFDRLSQIEKVAAKLDEGRAYLMAGVEYRHELEAWELAIAEQVEEIEKDFKKAKKARDKKVAEAEEEGEEHKEKRYKEDKKPKAPKYDAEKEALALAADGMVPLVVEVHRAAEIRNLLAMTERFDRLRLVIAGGSEALHSADELAERGVPVIVWPSLRGTRHSDELTGGGLELAGELAARGVTVLLGSGGRDGETTRDLPLLAALTVAHGFEREAAFEALTLGAATTFDLAHRLGSVEAGKEADLLVLDGDPLDTTTRVLHVICGGREVANRED
ncbi:MAG: amidohydrolase family protein [Planctomycetota bacterium]|jgi:hypothetical protein|nr:amidohydrolase family protein [Planctomycetota bacterium]MDP6763068.1 amidohydrolase family protein [Planctomycetota bacterium]MDP6989035.1 amidohydrolase family protein [Planctomycetota bacterium]